MKADVSIKPLDPITSDLVRYELGRPNWDVAWVPDISGTKTSIHLDGKQRIDVVILGDGYEEEWQFHTQLTDWLNEFFSVDVYDQFRGAFRIHALFNRSTGPCTLSKKSSFFRVPVGDDGIPRGEHSFYKDEDFGRRLGEALDTFAVNRKLYDANLDVGSHPVIHNQLAGLCRNLVVVMLLRTAKTDNASGATRDVQISDGVRVNVSFGGLSVHEFGHGFAYLKDEYIYTRGTHEKTPITELGYKSIFTLSNLAFAPHSSEAGWRHLSPWGDLPRDATATTPPPIVGWLWRGGDGVDEQVWHSEYMCLMNGGHENYAYDSHSPLPGVSLRWPNPRRFCLWCQEIVVIRILEKTGQLPVVAGDLNHQGQVWHDWWLKHGRKQYWTFFHMDQQILDREEAYASPELDRHSFDQILISPTADPKKAASYKPLWRSDLYATFHDEKKVAPFGKSSSHAWTGLLKKP